VPPVVVICTVLLGQGAAGAPARAAVVGFDADSSGLVFRGGDPGAPGDEVNVVTVSSDGRHWILRDAGTTPVTVTKPCVKVVGENAASCPIPAKGVPGFEIDLGPGGGSSLQTAGALAGLHMLVYSYGASTRIDVRDGEQDEVVCNGSGAVVTADVADRVWGGCETLNDRLWQQDTELAAHATSLDALGGYVGWIDGGRLGLQVAGVRSTQTPLGAGRTLSRLSLGRDAQGDIIAVFRGCPARRRCSDWYRLRLADGTLRRLHPSVPARCTIDSLSAWRAVLTIGASCTRPKQAVVFQRTANRARILMRNASRDSTPTLVSTRGRVTTVLDSSSCPDCSPGTAWLVRSGQHPCHAKLDFSFVFPDDEGGPGQPLLSHGTITWPYSLFILGTEYSSVTIMPLAGGCRVHRRERYVILSAFADAAIPVGRNLFYIRQPDDLFYIGQPDAGVPTVRERPLETTPGPISPSADWNFSSGH
jgi:hypothetical protein